MQANQGYEQSGSDTEMECQADLFDYIEPFYNRKRQHSTLGYVSPVKLLENWISTLIIQNPS
jgi:putative transposase